MIFVLLVKINIPLPVLFFMFLCVSLRSLCVFMPVDDDDDDDVTFVDAFVRSGHLENPLEMGFWTLHSILCYK